MSMLDGAGWPVGEGKKMGEGKHVSRKKGRYLFESCNYVIESSYQAKDDEYS